MSGGYIPISRKLFEHELWGEKREFNKAEAWIDLLRSVRWEANSTSVLIGNTSVIINRGEMPVSLRFLADRWKWSRNKVDGFLEYLTRQGMITKRTPDGTHQTVVTVLKYEEYNPLSTDDGTPKRTPKGHQRDNAGTKYNKENKSNNEKNISPPLPPAGDEGFEEVWTMYGRKGNKKSSMRKWAILKNHCREAARKHIPRYVASTPDIQYRKNFETYLNQEAWNDEIIEKSKPVGTKVSHPAANYDNNKKFEQW